MIHLNPAEIPHTKLHQYLLSGIAPRPIAFASTVDASGRPNLSPFSFFNVFGVNPTTLIFSPSRRSRDGSVKDTLENLKAVPEVVINVVTHDMVNQASLASSEYPKGVDEFVKSGFTKLPSEIIKPFRVKESPMQMECRVREIIETGTGGGAANLVICEILLIHISEDILGEDGMIDQHKIRLVGRLGKDFYVKAFGDALIEVEKPARNIGIGIDALPEFIRHSAHLTGNDLGKLGNLERMPSLEEIEEMRQSQDITEILETSCDVYGEVLRLAKAWLDSGHPFKALKILMLLEKI
ncbi:MAG TPA: flavin reductase family protein [Bacteroidales bacterium]|nr:flavin reductase family protein [Bacteroidales bacterium]HNQ83391.1 flavin reductase family protein [Bacteroidales bacterium]HOX77403.1 flavin reductase family protein [Bacteroidales bacterium]HPI86090.1 flavin reductase family protein [Bacteroidales bacterium]HPM93062.1 flavin reductase family protein [Bacteroidales bacterium]